MGDRSNGIAAADIERALEGGFASFRLPAAIEALYGEDTVAEQRSSVALNMIVVVLLFDSFVLNDYFMLRDDFTVYLIGKFLVVTPVCLLCVAMLKRVASYQFALWLFCVTLAGTLSAMLYVSGGAYRGNYLFGLLLIMVGAVALTRPGLRCALSAILVQCACFATLLFATDIVPPEGRVVNLLFCLSSGVIAAFTGYALETVNRRAFLLKLRVQLLNRDLQAAAVTDPLTGLGNRRAFEEATQAHWSRPSCEGAWVSLVLIDVDFFKLYNDTYGHAAGDTCLERVAGRVLDEIRGSRNLAIRFGGEEIAVFMPGKDFAQAHRLAEAIRQGIVAAAIPHSAVGPDGILTGSFGVASALTGDCTALDLFKRADAALYAAKRNGRNQVWPARIGTWTAPVEIEWGARSAGRIVA